MERATYDPSFDYETLKRKVVPAEFYFPKMSYRRKRKVEGLMSFRQGTFFLPRKRFHSFTTCQITVHVTLEPRQWWMSAEPEIPWSIMLR